MLSAAKNFAITFAASALIFGIIAYFVAGAVENGITAAGNDTGLTTESGTGDNADVNFVYVTDENGEAVIEGYRGDYVLNICGNEMPLSLRREDLEGTATYIL